MQNDLPTLIAYLHGGGSAQVNCLPAYSLQGETWQLIHLAARYSEPQLIAKLIESGASANEPVQGSKTTPLMIAANYGIGMKSCSPGNCSLGRHKTAEYLLTTAKADAKMVDAKGRTALDIALSCKFPEIATLIRRFLPVCFGTELTRLT